MEQGQSVEARADSARIGPERVPAASWAERLADAIAGGPLPDWVVYGTVATVFFVVLAASELALGGSLTLPLAAIFTVLAFGIVSGVWLVGAFDRAARRAVRAAAPLLPGGDARARELEGQIRGMSPWLPLAVGAVIAGGTFVRISLDPAQLGRIGLDPRMPMAWIEGLATALFGFSGAAYGLKVLHLGWHVHRITSREIRVDPWNVGPLLAFSTLTAAMAASIAIGLAAFYAVTPNSFSDPVGLASGIFAIALAAGVFVLPLVGVHTRLVEAKQALAGEAAREMESAIATLRRALAAGDLAAMDPLNKAIGALATAQDVIARIQTWPWQPETFRWVVGALMFPIVLFVLQFAISRTLGV